MIATELIEQLDGRLTDDPESLLTVQEIIDEKGIEAAEYYWLHEFNSAASR